MPKLDSRPIKQKSGWSGGGDQMSLGLKAPQVISVSVSRAENHCFSRPFFLVGRSSSEIGVLPLHLLKC